MDLRVSEKYGRRTEGVRANDVTLLTLLESAGVEVYKDQVYVDIGQQMDTDELDDVEVKIKRFTHCNVLQE